MKRTALLLLVALAAASCSSTSDDEPYASPARRQRPGGMASRGERAGAGALDLLPPGQWWRDPAIADAVKPTPDQAAALDKLSAQTGEIARLERDAAVAIRDLRNVVEGANPTAAEITNAANRVKSLRDAAFDRQIQLLSSERTLLSSAQWTALQSAIEQERQERMDRGRERNPGGMRPRGGRGGWGGGGRGRFPG